MEDGLYVHDNTDVVDLSHLNAPVIPHNAAYAYIFSRSSNNFSMAETFLRTID